MNRGVLSFLVITLIAGVRGFSGIAQGAAAIAQLVFHIFIVMLVVTLLPGGIWWCKASH